MSSQEISLVTGRAEPLLSEFEAFEKEMLGIGSDHLLVQKACSDVHGLKGAHLLPASVNKVLATGLNTVRLAPKIRRLDEVRDRLDRPELTDENYRLKKTEIAKHIALLVGSFPNASVPDPKVYTRMLVEDVLAAEPDIFTLESACRRLRRTAKFIPTISEVLATLEERRKAWEPCWLGLETILEELAEVEEHYRAFEAQRAAKQLELKASFKSELASTPQGAAVTHNKFGAGVVVSAEGERLTIEFGDGGRRVLLRSSVREQAQ